GEGVRASGRAVGNVVCWRAALRPGGNGVRVSDGAGHDDSAILHYARPGAPAAQTAGLVRDLVSSNRRSPAWFVDQAVQEQWPFYWECDATADNTFAALPDCVKG